MARRFQDFSFTGSLVPVALPDQPARFSGIGSLFILLSLIYYLSLGLSSIILKDFQEF
jgi:hypothetical protein